MRFLKCLKSAGKVLHGKSYLWSMMKKSSVSRMQRFMYFQILLCLGNDSWIGSKIHYNTELWTQLTENRWNSSGICSQDSPHCSSSKRDVQKFMNKMGEPEQFQGRIIFMSMFNGIIWRIEDNETECSAYSTLVSLFAKRFPAGHWSFLGIGSETKWYSTYHERQQREWDRVAELMMIKFGERGHPVFRVTRPLFRGTLKSKGGEQLSLHFSNGDTIETVFRTIISVNQLSIYEQSQTCVKNFVAVKQGDLLWQSNLIHISRQQIYW